MKFVTDSASFRDVLKAACEVAPSKGILPEQSCLFLVAEGDLLHVYARNESVEIALDHPCDVQETGEALVPSRLLLDYVSLASGEVSVSTDKKLRMTIKSGKRTSTLAGLESHRFAPLQFHGEEVFSAPGAELTACFGRTSFCTSADETRKALCGVHMDISNTGHITFIALDGIKISMCEMDKTDMMADWTDTHGLTIPNAALRLITGQFSDAERVTLRLEPHRACFSTPEKQLVFSLIVNPFLPYERVIPAAYSTSVLMDAKTFLDAVKLVEIAAAAAPSKDNRYNVVRMQADGQNGSFALSADTEATAAATEVDCDISGEDLVIYFNVRFIRDLAAACAKESGTLEFSFTGPGTVARLKPIDSPSHMATYVVPVRTATAG